MSEAVLPTLLRSLSLTQMVKEYESVSEAAQREGWTFCAYLRRLCENEIAQRARRRLERLLKESHLPETKTLANLNQTRLPLKVQRQLPGLLEGHFVEHAENVLAFGLPGRGKTHLLCALAREMIVRYGYRVWFTPTVRLIQQLLIAKRDLKLESFLHKLDGFDLIVLDDIGYVQQSREEMEVLFTFLSERYERKSLFITSNLVFSEWDKIFKDPMTTAAAIDRLVHHSIILELDGDSYRMAHAKHQKGKETK
jgi:DNA replication protein DnaC